MVNKNQDVYGITIPEDIAILRKDIKYTISESGTSIILSSGNKLTHEEIKNFEFQKIKL